MTVPTSDNREEYNGNDAATVFAYSFKIFEESDLKAFLQDAGGDQTPLVLNTDYSVSGAGDPDGGNVTYPLSGDPLATGEKLILLRVVPITQETDLRNQGAYYPQTVEDELDRSRMVDQQQQDEIDRALKIPEAEEDYDAGGLRIKSVDDPVDDLDAVNKQTQDSRFANDVITKTGANWDGKGARAVNFQTSNTPQNDELINAQYLEAYVASVIAGGEGVIPETYLFDGDGSTTVFSTPGITALDPSSYTVTIDGIDQRPTTDYTVDVAAETVTFNEAPPSPYPGTSDNIMVRVLAYKRAISEAETALIETATGIEVVPEAVDKRVIRRKSVAEIEALTPAADLQVSLSGTRFGIFEFDSSNLFAEVSADTEQQKYIAPSGEDGSNGAWVRLKDYESDLSAGIVDDPAVDNTQAVLTLLQNRDDSSAEFVAKEIKTLQPSPLPTDWEKGNIEIFGTDVFLKSVWEHTLFPIAEQDRSFLWVHSNTEDRVTSSVEGFNFTQVDSSTPGSGGANNHALVKFNGTKNSHFSFNDIRTASLGVSFHYQLKGTGITDSRDVHGLALGNFFEDLEKQGIEFIGASYGRLLGNTIVGDRRNSNALRLTGFDNNNDPFGNNSECLGVVGAANTVVGGRGGTEATGLGVQATAKFNYLTALYFENISYGIFAKDGSVDPSGNPSKNFFSATMNGVGVGINNEGCENTVFDTIIYNYEDNGIIEIPAASAGSNAGTNSFRGQVIGGPNTTGRAVQAIHDNHHFDLVVVDAPSNVAGNTVDLQGDNYTGSIKVINSVGNAIDVDGNDYNMELTCVNGGATSNILVNGSNNNLKYKTNNRFYILNGASNICSGESDDLRIDSNGNNVNCITATALVSGDNNVITGQVTGTLTVNGDNNKFIGIAGTVVDNGTGNTFV